MIQFDVDICNIMCTLLSPPPSPGAEDKDNDRNKYLPTKDSSDYRSSWESESVRSIWYHEPTTTYCEWEDIATGDVDGSKGVNEFVAVKRLEGIVEKISMKWEVSTTICTYHDV